MIEAGPQNSRFDRVLAVGLIAAAVAVLMLQLSSLFIFPQPNGLRWFGDETWLMSEAKTQITTGVVRYPLAVGSTLEHSKGLVLSMTWLSSCLYGIPAALLGGDSVAIGRVVTTALSVLLCSALFLCARRLGATAVSAGLAVLLLVTSKAFFFSGHSCRTDLLAGLIVLITVALLYLLAEGRKRPQGLWWLGFGAVITFSSLSSSVHLITLLLPVSIYFAWRLGIFADWRNVVFVSLGCAAVLAILVGVYYFSIGNLTLFSSSSTSHSQFHDVLSSIPILRPFSRSVQVSNLLIRMKQFGTEAPQAFLLMPLLILSYGSLPQRVLAANSIAWPISIVFLSWLLLEGSEVNYLIQILPLLLLCVAILVPRFIAGSPRLVYPALLLIAIVFGGIGIRDAVHAKTSSQMIDRSNEAAVEQIGSAIARTWGGQGKPRVVTEPAALDRLTRDSSIKTITDHFISFPTREEPLDSFVTRQHIDYFVLYNSPTYPKNRPRDDPFYRDVARLGMLQATIIGTSGDVGRDYFHQSEWKDTLLLFKMYHGGR